AYNKCALLLMQGTHFSYPQARQQWFSVCIFPLWQFFGFEPPFAARQEIARNPPVCLASYVIATRSRIK
ncbi:MAG: hypothetical protein JZU49_04560, partial [Sulfuricurvum sp.]|nr:hypothetical protein [Sulfuricurvum sp.]